jgi:hypothetical protein
MKKLSNLKGAKALSKNEQMSINGGKAANNCYVACTGPGQNCWTSCGCPGKCDSNNECTIRI